MNTANLQLEGLLIALARVLATLERRGGLPEGAVDEALAEAEAAVRRDLSARNVSAAEAEAVRFPIAFLRAAARDGDGGFQAVATAVGRARDRGRG